MPVQVVNAGVATLRVSTREATLLDLVRHQNQVGGIEAIARIARDFAPKMAARGLLEALDAMGQVPCAQRLGFILEQLGLERLAAAVTLWLEGKRKKLQPLSLAGGIDAPLVANERWALEYAALDLTQIQEQI